MHPTKHETKFDEFLDMLAEICVSMYIVQNTQNAYAIIDTKP